MAASPARTAATATSRDSSCREVILCRHHRVAPACARRHNKHVHLNVFFGRFEASVVIFVPIYFSKGTLRSSPPLPSPPFHFFFKYCITFSERRGVGVVSHQLRHRRRCVRTTALVS